MSVQIFFGGYKSLFRFQCDWRLHTLNLTLKEEEEGNKLKGVILENEGSFFSLNVGCEGLNTHVYQNKTGRAGIFLDSLLEPEIPSVILPQ